MTSKKPCGPVFSDSRSLSSATARRRRPSELLQVGGLRHAQRPVYRRACGATDVGPGTVKAVDVDGQRDPHRQRRWGASRRVQPVRGRARSRCSSARWTAPSFAAAGTAAAMTCGSGHRLDGPERARRVFPLAVEGEEIQAGRRDRAGSRTPDHAHPDRGLRQRAARRRRLRRRGHPSPARGRAAARCRADGGGHRWHPARAGAVVPVRPPDHRRRDDSRRRRRARSTSSG